MLHILIPEQRIEIGPSVGDKNALLSSLVDLFCADGSIGHDVKPLVFDTIHKREIQMSTAVGRSAAIPHAKLPFIQTPLLALSILDPPFRYDEAESTAVTLVFMVLSPAHDPEKHLAVLKYLAAVLEHSTQLPDLKQAGTARQAWEVLTRISHELSQRRILLGMGRPW